MEKLNEKEEILEEVKWQNLYVGDIVKVHKDEYFPADLLILESSDNRGQAFVETKNLDGETNLKAKRVNTFVKEERAKLGPVYGFRNRQESDLSDYQDKDSYIMNRDSEMNSKDQNNNRGSKNNQRKTVRDSEEYMIEYEGNAEENSFRDSNLSEMIQTQRFWISNETDQFMDRLRERNLQVFYEEPNVHLYKFKGFLSEKNMANLGIENEIKMSKNSQDMKIKTQTKSYGSSQQISEEIKRISKIDQERISQMLRQDFRMGSESHSAKSLTLEEKNILLRGSVLRNTEFVYGMVLYTGHDTKIMLNSVNASPKKSKLEEQLNRYIIYIFLFLILFCLLGTLMNELWHMDHKNSVGYIFEENRSVTIDIFIRFGNWILIFGNLIPISLMVSLEGVKFIQAIIISNDEKMYTEHNDTPCQVQSSNLNEELGQVEFIFSDKTGTLTKNEMVFRKMVIGEEVFGEGGIEPVEEEMSVEFIVSDVKVKGRQNMLHTTDQIGKNFD